MKLRLSAGDSREVEVERQTHVKMRLSARDSRENEVKRWTHVKLRLSARDSREIKVERQFFEQLNAEPVKTDTQAGVQSAIHKWIPLQGKANHTSIHRGCTLYHIKHQTLKHCLIKLTKSMTKINLVRVKHIKGKSY